MISVADALQSILDHVATVRPAEFALADSLGLVLAEDIVSDVDSPPFDKALMDGYAVRSEDLSGGRAELTVIEEVMAGRTPICGLAPGQATRIMTGAPIPSDCDAVVQVEHTRLNAVGNRVFIETAKTNPGRNIMRQGTAMRAGDRILATGSLIRPQEIGALAELGRHRVQAHRRPSVGVISTGDELVAVHESPGPGQIRNSNESMLLAQIARAGGEPVSLGIARDERTHLRERILSGLQLDVLLLSGGVSAGKLDLVPSELAAAGVEKVFHKVNVKPGKPIWFGVRIGDEHTTHVFGLPGNPVSSMVCFELFARTAIRRLRGLPDPNPPSRRVRLSQDHLAAGDRPTYYPASFQWTEDGAWVIPVNWHGSADLRATLDANAMLLFPQGDRQFRQGDLVDVIPWDD
ncbi:MAG: molybdopterin molybdotransferase MoeA [Planctomycetota bacterium]|nr:molybdopterin molybdotransferase MoeA [Planctomycetota bacterium]